MQTTLANWYLKVPWNQNWRVAKQGWVGPIRAKQGQMVPNDAKQSQTGPNGVKRGKTRPKRTLRGQTWPKGPNGPNEAKWGQMGLIFCVHAYFHETKKSCLATQALRLKLAELWQYCYFLGYHRLSLKALSLFLYLSEEIFFYIIWKLMYIALFWAVALNFWLTGNVHCA